MVDQAQLALIQAEIDGELNDRQRAELSRHLLADPLSVPCAEMRRLCRALDGLPEVEPPRMRTDILAALPQIQAQRTRRRGRW
jgi:anti-sigma factor RsiW